MLRYAPWLAQEPGDLEVWAVESLWEILQKFDSDDSSLLQAFVEADWLMDGLTEDEAMHLLLISDYPESEFLLQLISDNPGSSSSAPTPTPTPVPTPGPSVPVSELSWTRDGLTRVEWIALLDLQTFEQQFPEVAQYILGYTWVADGVTKDEQLALSHLLYLAQGGETCLPLRNENYELLTITIRSNNYLADGISSADLWFLERLHEFREHATRLAYFAAEGPEENSQPDRPAGSGLRWEFIDAGSATALHQAALHGGPADVEVLLDQGADIDARTEMRRVGTDFVRGGWTPLHLAVSWNRDPAVAALLLDRGADIHAKSEGGPSPIHWAVLYNDLAVVALLLDRGADVNAKTDFGVTPLHGAGGNENPAVAALLLDRGAQVNARSNSGYTPLHAAARYRNLAVASLILDRGADADINVRASRGRTPLHYAVDNLPETRCPTPQLVRLLVDRGADINAEDERGSTPCQLGGVARRLPSVAELLCNS